MLSVLAATFPDPVSTDSLIDALWGVDAPPTAGTGLRVVVNRLRDRLSDRSSTESMITNQGGHYRLLLADDDVDHTIFTKAVARARSAMERRALGEAIGLLETGLGLWRGYAFQPFESRWVAAAARTLTERRSAAEDLLVEALLEAGRTEEALAKLGSLMADFEIGERRWELLMLALYRSGRQAEALRTYQQAAKLFRDELGLEPGPGLRRLEQAILDHDPSLLLPTPTRPDRAVGNPVPVKAGVALADLVSLLKVQPTAAPVPGTAFIGRDTELDQLFHVLEANRLVTVLGPPGVGKTRLAGQLARGQTQRRVLWLDLTEHEPDAVVGALADQLDVRAPTEVLVVAVADALRSEPTLVVMDNCERLADVGGILAETLVRRCPDLSVLATSRLPLGCESEARFTVAALAPEHARRLLLERAFGAGADAARMAGQLDESDLEELLSRLDYLPLALELVASALRTRPLRVILDELSSSYDVLAASGRTDGRHERWSAALDWSVDALPGEQRQAFDHLGVLVGSFEPADLSAVCGFNGGAANPTAASSAAGLLVEHSLLRRAPEHEHFVALETIRSHARSRLEHRGELAAARTRHARHYANQVVEAVPGWQGPDEPQTVVRLLAAGPNLRAAFSWSIDCGLPDVAVDLAEHTWEHALFRLEFGLLEWADQVIDRFGPDAPRYCEMLATAALAAWGDGDFVRARSLAEASEEEADRRGIRISARSMQAQFNVASQTGRPDDAESVLIRQLDWCRRQHDLRQESSVLVNAAVGLAVLGEPEMAMAMADSAYSRAETTANPSTIAWATYARAFVTVSGDPARAGTEFTEAGRLARTVRNRFILGMALTGAAVARRHAGDTPLARSLLADAIELWTRGRMQAQLAWAVKEAVVLLEADGQAEDAGVAAREIAVLGPGQILLPEDERTFTQVCERVALSHRSGSSFRPSMADPFDSSVVSGPVPRVLHALRSGGAGGGPP